MTAPWAPMVAPPLPGPSEFHDTCEQGWQRSAHECTTEDHIRQALADEFDRFLSRRLLVTEQLGAFPALSYDLPSGFGREEAQPLV